MYLVHMATEKTELKKTTLKLHIYSLSAVLESNRWILEYEWGTQIGVTKFEIIHLSRVQICLLSAVD